jgi:predicted nucleic acid-binding protein
MPDVVSDTSVIQYLHQIVHLEVLHALYGRVLVPGAVADELEAGRTAGVDLPDLGQIPWLEVRRVSAAASLPIAATLGAGEREVLALACGFRDPLASLDDRAARNVARALSVRFTVTLGVLVRAKQAGHIGAVGPAVDRLEAVGFRLEPRTRAAVLELAGETP